MSYSNKIFNINGLSDSDLMSALQLASKDALICGYTIDNDEGLRIFFSKSLLPASAIINETPQKLENEFKVITTYLAELKDSIRYLGCDNVNEEIAFKDGVNYTLGWRVYIELHEKDGVEWWDHSIIVRPSYVIQ